MFSPFGIVSRIGIVGLVLGLSASIYAWTANNTANASRAGDGSATISRYTIASIVYTLNSTSPQDLNSVTITLTTTPTAGSKLKLGLAGSSGGTTWYSCT